MASYMDPSTPKFKAKQVMIWFPVLLFLTVFAHSKSEGVSTSEVAKNANAIVAEPEPNPETPAEPSKKDGDNCDVDSFSKIVCANDRLQFCGPTNQIMSTPCMVNGRQGFCNCEKDDCVADRPVCESETVKCYYPNTKLPDNMNCHKFFYCNPNGERITLECPGNLIYDPTVGKCMDQNTARCARIDCPKPGNTLQLVPFPQAKNYYLLCYKGFGDVRKCAHRYYAVRNNKCQFDCKLTGESGLFKDTDITKCQKGIYYACRRAGTTFTTVQAKCPPGMILDEDLGLCTKTAQCT